MSNFKMRVKENIGDLSKECFGKVGTTINVVNGKFKDKDNHTWDNLGRCYDTIEEINNRVGINCQYGTLFELVDTQSFTKQDLKDGMIIEDRIGWKAIVLNNNLIGLKIELEEMLELKDFNDDLTYKRDSDFDIVKIYEFTGTTLKELIYSLNNNLELLWESPEATQDEIKDISLKDIPTEKLLEEVQKRMCK